ncbi:MAG: beta-galactosidase [Chlorobi bacterium]|nr:beta-galactosidase [Chlorobiota bacterium]
MKYPLFFLAVFLLITGSCNRPGISWKPAPGPLSTRWTAEVDPGHPWPEYPRPQMVRDEWLNLNGLWEVAITPAGNPAPGTWNRQILVPFPVESSLSGLGVHPGTDSIVWYHRTVRIPSGWRDHKVLLHFEAADWETRVWVNGQYAGMHRGGYDPFTFDITDWVRSGQKAGLLVRVWDPTDDGTQPRGKQVNHPRGIWYTPVTGIWQTVWLEPVNLSYLKKYRVQTLPEKNQVSLSLEGHNIFPGTSVRAEVLKEDSVLAVTTVEWGDPVILTLPGVEWWEPDHPVLYDIRITLFNERKTLDKVEGYFGFRDIRLGKDDRGITRMMLNGRFLFQNGPLDQGFWPDGIYTPPTEEAMKYDLEVIRELGFNMLRKHVKVEPRRYYYWCDKMGILVWQDMPSGDGYIGRNDPDLVRSDTSAAQYKKELKQLIVKHDNHPSIVVWVPFNEGWGQFDTEGIVSFIRSLDSTRLINSASGWTDRGAGDLRDVHHYPEPVAPTAEKNRAIVLGEFGGLGLPVPGHTWVDKNWGYRNMQDSAELLNRYKQFYTLVWQMKDNPGLSASVYTQITDVETETNGLMTYDRKVIKIDPVQAHAINTGGLK